MYLRRSKWYHQYAANYAMPCHTTNFAQRSLRNAKLRPKLIEMQRKRRSMPQRRREDSVMLKGRR